MASKVYWCDMHTVNDGSVLGKFRRLLLAAGIKDINFDKRYVAIKMHFGEYGNLTFLRPNFAKVVADIVKEQGGKPFLTDCNTLYAGQRKDALEHLDCAQMNGFNETTTGCHVIIADGLRGTDEALIPINEKYVKTAKIGAALAAADIVISLAHFKGHEQAGFGGTLKNLGMGGGSRAGKMEQHCDGKPKVNPDKCIACGNCRRNCGQDAITIDKHAFINQDKCVGCGRCIAACPADAVEEQNYSSNELLCSKIAEYAKAVIKDKPSFHICAVIDVSPKCDCHASNDAPIVPDVGLFASFDPVALDRACADACNAQLPNAGDAGKLDGDVFKAVAPETDWSFQLNYAEKIGLGTQQYELVKVK